MRKAWTLHVLQGKATRYQGAPFLDVVAAIIHVRREFGDVEGRLGSLGLRILLWTWLLLCNSLRDGCLSAHDLLLRGHRQTVQTKSGIHRNSRLSNPGGVMAAFGSGSAVSVASNTILGTA